MQPPGNTWLVCLWLIASWLTLKSPSSGAAIGQTWFEFTAMSGFIKPVRRSWCWSLEQNPEP